MNESELEVRRWLTDFVKLGQYADMFIDDGFDAMETVITMNDDDLMEMGINKKGHRRKILLYIERRKNNDENNNNNIDYMANDKEGANIIDTAEANPNNDGQVIHVNIQDTAK